MCMVDHLTCLLNHWIKFLLNYISDLHDTMVEGRDGVSTIQMYSSTSTITLNMHEYEYSENKCTRVRLLYNILEYEYDYFRM